MHLHAVRVSFALCVACLLTSCTAADQARWNDFWGVKPAGSGVNARTAARSPAAAKGPEAAPSTASRGTPADVDTGPDPDNLNRNVSDYVATMSPPENSPDDGNVVNIRRGGLPPEDESDGSVVRRAGHEQPPADTGGSDTAAWRAEMARRQALAERNAAAEPTSDDSTDEPETGNPATPATAMDTTREQQKPATISADEAPHQTAQRPDSDSTNPNEGVVTANAGGASVDQPAARTPAAAAPSGPPQVAEISVRPISGEPATTAPQPNAAASVAPNPAATPPADSIAARIKRHEERIAANPDDIEEQYRLRMLYLVEGMDDKALASLPGVNRDIEEIILSQVRSLLAARSSAGRDPATWANRQLESIEELRARLRARADLQVPVVRLCTAVDGFGRYRPIENLEFPAGVNTLVLIYIEVDNFTSTALPSHQYRTLLSVRESLINRSGEELWTAKEENIEDVSRQQREDFFITIKRGIPKDLPPGEYVLKVEVEDMLAGKLNSNTIKFKIVP